ncbi:MAG: hypothetical protein A2Y56_02750 [Candidatus Aminicenantes bacterium RBG_13_63_10]|nr:MAG: hypothetical protein A2Y56_02750 [Candidatus Aminicenantes bacterium RBG_13_63_10]
MKKNMGETDRLIRTLLAIVIAVLIWTEVLKGTLAWIFGALGIVFLITSLIRFCPLYVPFRISTAKTPKA